MSTGLFLSHSSRDSHVAAEVKAQLSLHGYELTFLDFDPDDGIPAGRNWEQELYRQLRRANAVIVLCSPHSMESRWVFAEIIQARAGGKWIFPMIIADCEIPSILADRQVIDFRYDQANGYARLVRGLAEAGLAPGEALRWDPRRSPYPGLEAFEEEDAGVFFGRAERIREGLDLLNRIRRLSLARFVLVIGGSGSGKSSFVKAGLLPRLRHDPDHWLVVDPMRPGADPFNQLATALSSTLNRYGQHVDVATMQRALPVSGRSNDASWPVWLAQLRTAAGRSVAMPIIVVDQFEELFTISGSGSTFLAALRGIVDSNPMLMVLATLRSDFLGQFDRHPALADFAFEPLHLSPPPRGVFAEIIEGPARLAAIDFGPGLVQALIDEAHTDDALPLLAFALRELWEQFGKTQPIPLEAYRERLGGLPGAIARVAESALPASLSEDDEKAVRTAFLRMVRLNEEGQYMRRPARWEDLPLRAHPSLELLVRARILVSRGADDPASRTVEVTHEAVFRSWKRLAAWLAEDREFLLWRRRLIASHSDWVRTSRDDGALLRGISLSEASRWLERKPEELNLDEREYIEASLRRRDEDVQREEVYARRRRREIIARATMGFSLGSLIPLAMAFLYIAPGMAVVQVGVGFPLCGAVAATFLPTRDRRRSVIGFAIAYLLLGGFYLVLPVFPSVQFFAGVLDGALIVNLRPFAYLWFVLAFAIGGLLVGYSLMPALPRDGVRAFARAGAIAGILYANPLPNVQLIRFAPLYGAFPPDSSSWGPLLLGRFPGEYLPLLLGNIIAGRILGGAIAQLLSETSPGDAAYSAPS